jgi:hypothetical protein
VGFLSPRSNVQNTYGAVQDAQDAYAAWQQAASRAAAEGKAPPPAPPHPEEVMQQLRTQSEFNPENPSSNDGFMGRIGNPDPIPAPWRGEFDMPGNFERKQHMADSMANDAMLRELGRSRRQRTEEDGPEGAYALAPYPGLEFALMGAEAGLAPVGSMPAMGGSPMENMRLSEKRKAWAKQQKKLIGRGSFDAEEYQELRRAMKGRGAKQRRQASRSYMMGV